jgi:peroxiredoxin
MTDTLQDSTPSPDTNRIGLAITSLILGILSLVLSLFLVGGILAVIGLVLGGIHLGKRTTFRAMALWGVSLSILGLLATGGMGYLYYQAYKQVLAMRGGAGQGGVQASDWQGVKAPDFTVTNLNGQPIRLAELRGKRVVLDFWATWCPPCRKEIPHFIRLAKETDAKDLVIVGISSEDQNTIMEFVKKNGVNYAIAAAPDRDLPSPYKEIRSIPTTFFVDRNGVIQAVFTGYHDYDALKAAALGADFKGAIKPAPAAEPAK